MGFIKRVVLTAVAAVALVAAIPIRAEGSTMSIGATARQVAETAALYQSSADLINKTLTESLRTLDASGTASAAFRAGRSAELLDSIRGIVKRTGLKGVKVVSPAVESSFTRGAALAAEQAKELGLGGRVTQTETSGGFVGVNERTVDAIAADSVAKMQANLAQHGENAAGLFRSLSTSMAAIDSTRKVRSFSLSEREVNRVIAQGIITGDPRQAMGAMRRLIGEGAGFDKGLIDNYRKVGNQLVSVGAWTGTVRTYAEMVVRTRTAEAQVEGQIDRQASLGLDLAQITGSNSTNFCTRFVGLVVVVRGGARDGYVALSELPGGGPPFHPNCTKTLAAFVPDLVSEGRVEQSRRAQVVYERAAANGSLMEPWGTKRAA